MQLLLGQPVVEFTSTDLYVIARIEIDYSGQQTYHCTMYVEIRHTMCPDICCYFLFLESFFDHVLPSCFISFHIARGVEKRHLSWDAEASRSSSILSKFDKISHRISTASRIVAD